MVVLENTDVADALAQPYLKSLSEAGAYLGNYCGITHPSGPNTDVGTLTLGIGNLGRNDATASLITNVWKQ